MKEYDFQVSQALKLFMNDKENAKNLQYTNNAINFIRKYTSKRKEYYVDLLDIICEYFNLDNEKFTDGLFVITLIYSSHDNTKTITKIDELFEINMLNDENLYVKLYRTDLNNSKGRSCLFPLTNVCEWNNFNINEPINIYLHSSIYTIHDYHYFKVLYNNGNGTHRTVGICESLGLLQNCKLAIGYERCEYINIKETIDNIVLFIKEINSNNQIKKINMNNKIDYSTIEFILNNNKEIHIQFNDIFELVDFVIKKDYLYTLDKLSILNADIITITEDYFKITPYTDKYLSKTFDGNPEKKDLGINKLAKKINITYRAYNKFSKKYKSGVEKYIDSTYKVERCVREYAQLQLNIIKEEEVKDYKIKNFDTYKLMYFFTLYLLGIIIISLFEPNEKLESFLKTYLPFIY